MTLHRKNLGLKKATGRTYDGIPSDEERKIRRDVRILQGLREAVFGNLFEGRDLPGVPPTPYLIRRLDKNSIEVRVEGQTYLVKISKRKIR